jgi:acetoin utilization protein AcuB
MLVRDWMSTPVITVDVRDTMYVVKKTFEDNNIRRVPVFEKGRLVGIISDRDMRRVTHSETVHLATDELIDFIKKVSIKENMTPDPITVSVEHTIDEAAVVLLENKISGLPVLSPKGDVAGMITQADIFRAMASLTGVREKGIQVALELTDTHGSIGAVTEIIRHAGGHILSILSTHDRARDGYRKVYIKTSGIDWNQIGALKAKIQENGNVLYFVDHENDRREIA